MSKSSSLAPDVPAQDISAHGALYTWVDARLGLEELKAFAAHKVVPEHRHAFWYYWGGLSLFFFLVQVITGILLLVYYRPARRPTIPCARLPTKSTSGGSSALRTRGPRTSWSLRSSYTCSRPSS
jgi:quinol-cytochrome oxidoreductase complex cytochrome b subunit